MHHSERKSKHFVGARRGTAPGGYRGQGGTGQGGTGQGGYRGQGGTGQEFALCRGRERHGAGKPGQG